MAGIQEKQIVYELAKTHPDQRRFALFVDGKIVRTWGLNVRSSVR